MSAPTREELLNTISMLNLALNGISIELTQGYNTMPRRRDLRDAVNECMTAEFCGRKVLERAQCKAEGNGDTMDWMSDLLTDTAKAEGNA